MLYKIYNNNYKVIQLTLIIFVGIIVGSFLAGCSAKTKHEVLTFFFTGVPEPDQVYVTSSGNVVTLPPRKNKRRRVPAPTDYTHGPYAARQCQQCHTTGNTSSFRTWDNNTSKAGVRKNKGRQRISGKLVMPIDKICITCHESQSETRIGAVALKLHEPVEKGLCYQCHHPHQSTRQYMLRKDSNIVLCHGCHKEEELMVTTIHQENSQTDCVQCHNPHQGKTALLLKADFDEWDRY